MTGFTRYQHAARELISIAKLKPKEGQFLGGLLFSEGPISDRQRNWLAILLDRHGLPPLTQEAHLG
jgi:hypothetical protein